jgi:hypothetical protein
MGNTSAGKVGGGNEGQTDMDRGSVNVGSYSKGMRNTGKAGSMGSKANSNTDDGNKRPVRDPRLA